MSNITYTGIGLPLVPITVQPLNDIVPFTSRSGASFAELFYGLRDHIDQVIIPALNANQTESVEKWNEVVADLVSQTNTLVQELIDGVVNESIELQDIVLAELIDTPESLSGIKLYELLGNVIREDPTEPGAYLIGYETDPPQPGNGNDIPDPNNPGFWIDA